MRNSLHSGSIKTVVFFSAYEAIAIENIIKWSRWERRFLVSARRSATHHETRAAPTDPVLIDFEAAAMIDKPVGSHGGFDNGDWWTKQAN